MTALPTGILFTEPRNQPLSGVGAVQPLCVRKFFLTTTSTPANVYTDGALAAPFSPTGVVTADTAGRFAAIYLDPNVTYRSQLFNSIGTLLEDVDPYIPGGGGSVVSGTAVLTLTGIAGLSQVTASYTILNGSYFILAVPALSGTSNSTSTTITGLPAAVQNSTGSFAFTGIAGADAGVIRSDIIVQVGVNGGGPSGTLTCYKAAVAAATWTATGQKAVGPFTIAWPLNGAVEV